MSGLELLERLKEEAPEVIRFLVTAFSDVSILKEAINRANVYRFVPKPVEPEALRLDILRAFEHRALQRMLLRAQKMSVLGQLALSVVHDLRNYLQIIKGTPYFLRKSGRKNLEKIAARLEHVDLGIEDLIEELLSLARGKKPNYRLADVALGDLVRRSVEQCRGMPDFAKHTLEVDIEEGLPNLPLSRNRMERMVQNLLLNAVQATPAHGTIRVELHRAGGRRIELRVIDDGVGIPAGIGDQIFDPFFSTKGQGGVGLGLAIARAVVEAHGGALTYESLPGKGTTFIATFPLPWEEDAKGGAPSKSGPDETVPR